MNFELAPDWGRWGGGIAQAARAGNVRPGQAVGMQTSQLSSYQASELVNLAKRAGECAARGPGRRFLKEDGSPVCEREVEIERILVAGLAQIDAPAGVTSEEGALCSGEAVWAIDPIDGTQNYLTGDPHWAIVLGRLNCGQADFGISYFPALDLFIGGGPSFGLDIKGQFERRSESLPRRAMVPRFFRAAYCNESRWDLRSRRCTSWHFAAVALGLAEVCLIGPNWQPWDVVGGCALLGGAKLAVRHVDGDDLDLADPFRRPILGGTPSLMDSFAADLLG